MTLGELMMFLVYLTMLLGPLATLTGSAVQFQNNLAGLDRILDVMETPVELPDRPRALRLNRSSVLGGIKLENVSFRYPGSDSWVLRNISMTILPNQTIALVGRSGAGKTTLCNLIARFYDPDEGRILPGWERHPRLSIAVVPATVGRGRAGCVSVRWDDRRQYRLWPSWQSAGRGPIGGPSGRQRTSLSKSSRRVMTA